MITTHPSIFVIGDSISLQYGPYLEQYTRGVFRYDRKRGDEGYENLDIPTGANAGDSSMVLSYLRFLQDKGDWRPDWLLLNCGLHDIKTNPDTGEKQVPLETYKANLRGIVNIAEELAVPLIWIRITPVDDEIHNSKGKDITRHAVDVDAYNAAADAIMEEADIPDIDLFTFTANLGPSAEIFCDHVHFTEPVRERQAAYIAGYLDGIVEHL